MTYKLKYFHNNHSHTKREIDTHAEAALLHAEIAVPARADNIFKVESR